MELDFQTVDALVGHISAYVRVLWYAAIALTVVLGIFVSQIVPNSDAEDRSWRVNRNLFVIAFVSSALSIIGGGSAIIFAIDMVVQAGAGKTKMASDSYSTSVSFSAFCQGFFLLVSFVFSTILVARNFRSIAQLTKRVVNRDSSI